MSTIHMDTSVVLALAQQLKQTAEQTREQAARLNGAAIGVDWIGPSREEFVAEAQAIIRAIEAQAEAGVVLAGRVERETAEWEQAASSLGGSGGVGTPISGGSAWNWPTLPVSPLTPIFTFVTIAPWLAGTPGWLSDLYRKFFPTPAPIPLPDVISPVIIEPVKTAQTGSFGDLLERPAVLATPSAQPQASQPEVSQIPTRPGYSTYYDIPPKAQGAAYGGAACLPTSFSMVTDYYHQKNPDNQAVSPQELVKMLDSGDGTPGKGVTFDKLNDDLGELGYQETRYFQSDLSGLKGELQGGPVVVNVKVNLTSLPERALGEGNGYNHAILVKGISETNVLVNDPWSGKEMEIPAEKFERMWKNGDSWVQVVRP